MKLIIEIDPPHRWIVLDQKNQARESGTAQPLMGFTPPRSVNQIIGVARGENVACHSVEIPGKRRQYVEAALPYALEEQLSEDVEDLHFKLLAWQPQGRSQAAVVSRGMLDGWLQRFSDAGIVLDGIVPEYFLLPLHPDGDISISSLADDERICIRSEREKGIVLDAGDFSFWWQSVDKSRRFSVTDVELARRMNAMLQEEGDVASQAKIRHWDIGDHFCQWLTNSHYIGNFEALSLLSGAYQTDRGSRSRKFFRIAAGIVMIAVVGHWAGLKYEQISLTRESRQIDAALRELFTSNFPDQPYLDRPRSQINNILGGLRANRTEQSDFKGLMLAISRVAPGFGAVVEEINFSDNEMTVIFKVNSLSALDQVEQALNRLEIVRADLVSSGARDNKITGRFRLRMTG